MSFEQIITELNKVFEGIEGVPPHVLSKILNAFEMLIEQINLLKEENQKLKDENSRLKGEQGKPEVRKQTKPGKDTSSESERAPRDKPKKIRLKKKGLVFMNEIGVDPGIDHMSAMQVIDRIRAKGGKMLLFE